MTRFIPLALVSCICLIALAFGLVRVGVSLLLTLQTLGVFEFGTFREPVMEVEQFLSVQNARAFIPFSPLSYFAIIAVMGFCLIIGAVLAWHRNPWGYGVLTVYLLAHAGLFVNFQTINPKVSILIGGIILLVILFVSNRQRPLSSTSSTIETNCPDRGA